MHCISLHPPSNGRSYIVYPIDRTKKSIVGSVGLNDTAENCSPVVFRVNGLFTSRFILMRSRYGNQERSKK